MIPLCAFPSRYFKRRFMLKIGLSTFLAGIVLKIIAFIFNGGLSEIGIALIATIAIIFIGVLIVRDLLSVRLYLNRQIA